MKEPTRRVRFLTRDDAQALLAQLPEHLADMAAFDGQDRVEISRRNLTGMDGRRETGGHAKLPPLRKATTISRWRNCGTPY